MWPWILKYATVCLTFFIATKHYVYILSENSQPVINGLTIGDQLKISFEQVVTNVKIRVQNFNHKLTSMLSSELVNIDVSINSDVGTLNTALNLP